MPFNGSGTFEAISAPDYPAVSGTPILASQFNNTLADVFAGLTQCITRNGQSPATANLPMGGFKLTGLAAGSATGQALTYGQAVGSLTRLAMGSGLVGTPAIYNVGDTDTGLYWPGTDSVGLAVGGISGFRLFDTGKVRLGIGAVGDTELTNTMPGLELLSGALNTVSYLGYGIKFMSQDSDFTTLNPKFLAGILPYAIETYNADTKGGMGMTFLTSPADPGANVDPIERWRIQHNGHLIPQTDNAIDFGSSSLRIATGYFYDVNLADDLTVSGDASVAGSLTVTAGADVGTTLSVGSGNAWQFDANAVLRNLGNTQPCFRAVRATSDQTSGTTLIFNSEEFDQGADYNAATGVYTAPVTGLYHFEVKAVLRNDGGSSDTGSIRVSAGGATVAQEAYTINASTVQQFTFSLTLRLTAADTVFVVNSSTMAAGAINHRVSASTVSYFSGFLVC
jgi:hypothetical protein